MPEPLFFAKRKSVLLLSSALVLTQFGFGRDAHAQAASQIDVMEKQIRLLQVQLKEMKVQQVHRDHEVAEARENAKQARMAAEGNPYAMRRAYINSNGAPGLDTPPPYMTAETPYSTAYGRVSGVPSGHGIAKAPIFHKGQFNIGPVTITLGGFLESAGIFRTRNETADISSNFGAIPWGNSPNAHINEYHQTERQSRFAALVAANVSKDVRVSAYTELDFQGAGSSSNSRQSNSYVLRSRLFYGAIEDTADDFYISGGQMWSLATMFKHGMGLRDEQIPLVIDAQYVPGFTWLRNTGVRAVKGFDHGKYHIGVEISNPQAVINAGSGGTYIPKGALSVTDNNSGGQVYNSDTTYSTDVAPDFVIKGTADPKFGHFEAFGLGRFLHDRVSYLGRGDSHTKFAGGGGGGMVIPIIKNKFDFQASGLAGVGIGRYGTSNLPDYTLNSRGAPAPLPEAQVLVGLIGHPTKSIDLYAYGGMEQILNRSSFNAGGKSYGYGNPNYNVTGCDTEGAASGLCQASIKRVAQGTVGFWWRYLKGDYGTVQLGAQYSYTNVAAFRGVGGTPHTDDNMIFFSMRYLPFQ
ncbi:hypothetical protein J2D73_05630 [Acetobacter sacchari]|uniref:Porin n=2 Tax=Acetobacter sacchari TaxID=2661687 RepID=A0ABS3LTR7_9PROT|nr:hypothetical protein [Acetobacter sacchari]